MKKVKKCKHWKIKYNPSGQALVLKDIMDSYINKTEAE